MRTDGGLASAAGSGARIKIVWNLQVFQKENVVNGGERIHLFGAVISI